MRFAWIFVGVLAVIGSTVDGAIFAADRFGGNRQEVLMPDYFAVDAKTGQMIKVHGMDGELDGWQGPEEREQVLFVAPSVSMENRYVPYPGAAPQEPPQMFAQHQPEPQMRPVPQRVRPRRAPVMQPSPSMQYPEGAHASVQSPSGGGFSPKRFFRSRFGRDGENLTASRPVQKEASHRGGKKPWWTAIFHN